jgi:hypothetical protein
MMAKPQVTSVKLHKSSSQSLPKCLAAGVIKSKNIFYWEQPCAVNASTIGFTRNESPSRQASVNSLNSGNAAKLAPEASGVAKRAL